MTGRLTLCTGIACLVLMGGQAVLLEDFSRGMERWWVEGSERVYIQDGRLYVDADNPQKPGGGAATVWCRSLLPTDFELEVDAHVVSSTLHANNINLFFAYSDPSGKPLDETRAARLHAGYDLYHQLNGYIITFVNDQGKARVRIRRNPGFHLLAEVYGGECRQGVTYHLRVRKFGGEISFSVNGEQLLNARDAHPLGAGLLGLRTYRTRLWWDNLGVHSLELPGNR